MTLELKDYLSALGRESMPERWAAEYPRVMAEYEKYGNPYVKAEYYEYLNKKYGMLEGMLEVYCGAAQAVAENEILSHTLLLIARMNEDRAAFKKEYKSFPLPRPKEGEPSLPYDMLPALALASMADYCYENLKSRDIPKEHIDRLMKTPEGNVRSKVNNGLPPRHDLFDWDQHAIDGQLFTLGRLQIHVGDTFGGYVSVFENSKGERIPLADYGLKFDKTGFGLGALYHEDEEDSFVGIVEEDEKCYTGYPYTEMGTVKREKISLDKNEWKKIFCRDDYVIKLHIPSGGGLTPEAVDASLMAGREFVKKYFPDFKYKGYSCYSWLCDPTLSELVGENANIAKFSKRFQPLTVPSNGRAVFRFVYKNANIEIDDIPEDTTLSRALKARYKNGGAVYDFRGYFFED